MIAKFLDYPILRMPDFSRELRTFVEQTKRESRLIMGIGHRVKSISNPDSRVTLIKEFVTLHLP